MFKPTRAIIAIAGSFIVASAIPEDAALQTRSSSYSFLAGPILFSRDAAKTTLDFFNFHKNAEENKRLRTALARAKFDRFQMDELVRENARLRKLLDMKAALPLTANRSVAARVIGRSPLAWNRAFLIDKGSRDGIKPQMPVIAELALVGKVIEVGPSASKVLLITDPNSRVGAMLHETRQEGVLFGTSSGECRMKYLSLGTQIKAGDLVETAGFGGSFPKGLPIGNVRKVWKEPGQMYQVAVIGPLTDLSRVEEVICIE